MWFKMLWLCVRIEVTDWRLVVAVVHFVKGEKGDEVL